MIMGRLYVIHSQNVVPPQASQLHPVDLRQLARYLLLQLNPAREGDVATILEQGSQTDHQAVMHWLEQHPQPWSPEENLTCLRREILDKLNVDPM